MTLADMKTRVTMKDVMALVVFALGIGGWIESQRGQRAVVDARLAATESQMQAITSSIDSTKAYAEQTYSRKDVIASELQALRGTIEATRQEVADLRRTVTGKGEQTR
jgi:uncharacterized protein HemX